MKTITLLVALSREALDNDGATLSGTCDTVKEAKIRARYYMSAKYAKRAELSEPLGFARVTIDGEVVFEWNTPRT